MSLLSRIFGQKKTPVKTLFIDENDPEEKVTIKMVDEDEADNDDFRNISDVYSYLRQDWQQRGFEDAIKNPELSNLALMKNVIVDDFNLRIQELRLKYEMELHELEHRIDFNRKNLLDQIAEDLEVKKKKHNMSIDELQQIKASISEEGSIFRNSLKKYEAGFIQKIRENEKER